MIIRGLRIVGRQIIYMTVILATLLTLLIIGVYWLSHAIEQRQGEIAIWLGDQVGYPVEVGTASLDWVGLKPKLQIGDVTLFDEGHKKELITLGNLYLGLDLIDSIQSGQVMLNDIAITDLKLSVIRDYSGQLQIQNFNLPTASEKSAFDWKSFALLLDTFQFEGINIDYTDQINTALSGRYELISASINKHRKNWDATANMMMPTSLGRGVVLTAQAALNDDASQLKEWQAQVRITELQIGALTQNIDWQGIMMPAGSFTGQVAITGIGKQVDKFSTDFNLSHVNLVSNSYDFPAVRLDSMHATIDWKQQQQAWQLSGKTSLSVDGEDWPDTIFSVKKQPDGAVNVQANYLRLSDLSSLASLSNNAPDLITKLQPAGDLEALTIQYSDKKGLIELAFNLKEGVLLAWQDYPGVTNLTTQFEWNKGVAHLRLDSHDLTLYTKPWLEDSLFFDVVSGDVTINYGEEIWQIDSRELHVWNEDLAIQLDGEVKKTADGKIINDLKIALDNIAINQWKKYVPRQSFHPDFVTWSDKAFVAGKISSGEIILKGELAAFPYEQEPEKGQFNMHLHALDVQLHYGPGWPDLTGLTGTITGTGNDLVIKTKQGKTAGFDFIDVTTVITHLTEKKPILRLEGEVTGTTAKALQFLKDSPLKERFGAVADSAIAKGKSNISLQLMVPLANVDKTSVEGYVSFKNSQLKYKASPEIGLTDVNGKLYFNEKGVHAKSILARAFNEAVTIDVKPNGDKAIISASSHINVAKLKTIWLGKVPQYITGRTAYKLDLVVVEKELGKFYLDVDLSSNLKGLTLDLPAPLGKKPSQVKPLNITIQNSNNNLIYTAKYADILNVIAKPKDKLWQGEIWFGKGKATLPKNGIKISGQLKDISIDNWLSWAEQQQGSKSAFINSIDDISLSFTNLTGFEQQVPSLNIASQKDAGGWRTHLNSPQIKGYVYLPDDLSGSAVIQADLERLAITLPKKSADKVSKNKKSSLWPSVDFSIDTLLLDNKPLGKLILTATKTNKAWMINSAQLSSNIFTLSILQGEWQKHDTSEKTELTLQLESDDLDMLLANFDYQQAIDAEKVFVKAKIAWPSEPLDFDIAKLAGTMKMDIGKGTLQDIEPGAAGRIFGLMSIAALPRRLSLDFSDLFGKGFTFDSITGDFKFKSGLALTDNFMLKSASAEIIITGVTDLVNQQYDQIVTVTPNVSSTLPLAGAVAGGPIGLGVGTAILLVDKLTDKLFDKNIINVISYKYDLTGPWDDPAVKISTPKSQDVDLSAQQEVIRK